jgi:hypothetical protein
MRRYNTTLHAPCTLEPFPSSTRNPIVVLRLYLFRTTNAICILLHQPLNMPLTDSAKQPLAHRATLVRQRMRRHRLIANVQDSPLRHP